MFSSLEKARELSEHFLTCGIGDYEAEYEIKSFELNSICEDYITARECCEDMEKEMARLKNYIRLLEKENQELRGQE